MGIDEVDGGDGEDILEINYSSNTFAGGNGYNAGIVTGFNDDGSGSFSGNLYAYKNSDGGYDEVYFSNIERFRITGTNFNDDIRIGWNNDTVNGGGGDDYINAVEGIDSIDGGAGIDTIGYTNLADATNNLTINSSGATITANNGTVIKNVEQFINLDTGSGKDNIAFTGRFNNREWWGRGIFTGDGNDTINAGLGDDRVDGGNGTDTLIIDYSSNTYAGTTDHPAGIGSDYNPNNNGGYDGWLSANYNDTGNYDRIEFYNIERLNIIGTGKDDYFTYGGGTISIDGGAGTDIILSSDLSNETANLTINNSGATITQANGTVIKNVEQFTNLYTGSGNDNIAFTGRFDNRYGNGGIFTGNGNDTINAGLGDDRVDGGNGTDILIIDYSSNTYAGTSSYPAGIGSDYNPNNSGGYDGWVSAYYDNTGKYDRVEFSNIEKLSIIGTGKDDYFKYGGGTITVDGGAGTDVIGWLDLSNEKTNLTIDNSGATITQANGTVIKNVEQFENITTGSGNDNIAFTGRFNTNQWWWWDYGIKTGNGNDTINPGLGQDEVSGGFGTDTLVIDYSSNTFSGGGGYGAGIQSSLSHEGGGSWGGRLYSYYNSAGAYDEVYFTQIERFNIKGTSGGDVLYGGSGADTLIGNNGNDSIESGGGNDILDGGSGTDTLKGGKGNDTYINPNGDRITELEGEGIDTVESNATFTLNTNALANVENLTLTGTTNINGTGNGLRNYIIGNTANNTLSGFGGNDTLLGDAGNDTLDGSTGNDILDGGTGSDSLAGGLGNDIYIIDNSSDIVVETSSSLSEIDTVQSSITYTLGANVENLTLTGTNPINGTGNGLNNYLTGNTGNNTLDGGGGNDTLNGGGGNDTLIGGTGNDVYIVDSTTNTVTETSAILTEIDTVQSSITYTLGTNVENLLLTGTTAINGTGNTLNNLITGNTRNNVINGGDGDDTLDGGGGNDTLIGGSGNDVYIVDSKTDVVTETSVILTEIDTVQSSISYTLRDNLENLTLTGTTAINGTGNTLNNLITGNNAANILNGNKGADTLMGGNGNDTLIGGLGNDSLIGGNGSDRFVGGEGNDILNLGLGDAVTDTVIYNSGDGNDTLNEFTFGNDKFAFVGLTSVDVVTSGADTQFRLGNGIIGDAGFAMGSLLFTITGVNTFTTGNIASNVDASNTASFFFS